MEGNGNSEGSGAQKEAISKGVGGGGFTSQFFFFSRAPSKIDEQAISYFTVNQCFKSKIIVLIHK